uniref:Uncharacterized protein n=1 Tax=Phytophthora ramorum TaxID=164328 RepID=H3HCX2_PHYRM
MGSFRASGTGQDNLTKLRLTDAKDNGNRFQSDNGRAYLRQRAEDVEDRQILREGRGVAIQLHPARVHVPPWEQVVVRVTCFNNMPGTYVDDVVSRATGAPPVFLHANVGVVGTPLALDRNCVGLHFGKPVPEGRPPWKLVENGREDQLVNVTLRVDFGSRVQLRITPCDENNSAAAALPFIVEPQSAMVPAFSTAPFRVTFEPSKHGVSAPRALLLADAHCLGSTTPSVGGDPRQEDASGPTRQSNNSPSSTTHVAAGKAFAAVRMANAMVRKPGPVTDSLAPRHPLSMADLPPAHRRSAAQGESYMFMLPPQMSFDGQLRVKFATKSVQTIRLAAVVLRPAIVVSPSAFYFGRFHPRESGRRYKSRFRFTVEHGRDFEVMLEGTGHLNEVDNPRDGDRPLVRVRELEHSYYIFRGT